MSLSPFPIFDSVVVEQNFDPRTVKHRDSKESQRAHRDWYSRVTRTVQEHTPEEVVGRLHELRKQGTKPSQNGGRSKAQPRIPAPRLPSE